MENIRHKSLVRLLKWIVNLALATEIVLLVAIILIMINTIASNDDTLMSAYPIKLNTEISGFQIISDNIAVERLAIINDSATIRFTVDSLGYNALKILDVIISFIFAIGITLITRKIFKSLENNHPFTRLNALRLRKIALLLILIFPYSIAKGILYRSYIINNINIQGKKYSEFSDYYLGTFFHTISENEVWVNLNINFQALLLGAVMFLIAEIFRIGIVMKEDNESIV